MRKHLINKRYQQQPSGSLILKLYLANMALHKIAGACFGAYAGKISHSLMVRRKAALEEMTLKAKYRDYLPMLKVWSQAGVRSAQNSTRIGELPAFKQGSMINQFGLLCFYVNKAYRFHWSGGALLQGAVNYAQEQGAKIVEGYPLDMQSAKLSGHKLSGDRGISGIADFRQSGFVEVACIRDPADHAADH
jgi:GNAT superfamily N-acetyltransferase